MTLCNDIYKEKRINKKEYQTLLLLLNPFAPHITEEIWEKQKFTPKIYDSKWPICDETKLIKNSINLPVQINGKMRGTIEIVSDLKQEEILEKIKKDSVISKYISNDIKKIILVPNRIINIIC